jgi:hypothetical protein
LGLIPRRYSGVPPGRKPDVVPGPDDKLPGYFARLVRLEEKDEKLSESEGIAPSSSSGKAHIAIGPWRPGAAIAIVWLPPATPSNPKSFCLLTNFAVVVQLHRGLRPLRAHEKDKVYRAKLVPTDTGTDNFYTVVQLHRGLRPLPDTSAASASETGQLSAFVSSLYLAYGSIRPRAELRGIHLDPLGAAQSLSQSAIEETVNALEHPAMRSADSVSVCGRPPLPSPER